MEQGPRSLWLCLRCPRNESLVPWTLLSLSWKTQPNWNQFQNALPSNEGRELCHLLLFCFDVPDPVVKSESVVCELISALKDKKQNQGGQWFVKPAPKILTCKDHNIYLTSWLTDTTTSLLWLSWSHYNMNGRCQGKKKKQSKNILKIGWYHFG